MVCVLPGVRDVGYISKEGFLYLKDRSKDMLIRGGEKWVLLLVWRLFVRLG